ncbi:MAG TPA: hypothetical protein ENJ60_09950 [Aeromonadales bacterium]|nr:hypothetical protein [Aeromonadales bacterium]
MVFIDIADVDCGGGGAADIDVFHQRITHIASNLTAVAFVDDFQTTGGEFGINNGDACTIDAQIAAAVTVVTEAEITATFGDSDGFVEGDINQVSAIAELLVYAASKKWTMPIHNWKQALNRPTTEFEGQLAPHL